MCFFANTICFCAALSLSLSKCRLHSLGSFVFKLYNKFVTRVWGQKVVAGFRFFEKFWSQGWIISSVWEQTRCLFIPKPKEKADHPSRFSQPTEDPATLFSPSPGEVPWQRAWKWPRWGCEPPLVQQRFTEMSVSDIFITDLLTSLNYCLHLCDLSQILFPLLAFLC